MVASYETLTLGMLETGNNLHLDRIDSSPCRMMVVK